VPAAFFGWWIAKAVLSGLYWLGVAHLIAPMLFGDRIGTDGAIQPDTPAWASWAAVIAAVLIYAVLSAAWNRAVVRRRG
jgi:protein-S-isoprenylcysteine O-methyltransferase Ste14